MSECTEKKSAGRFGFSRIGSSFASRNPNREDGSIKCCNRLGCSTRYYSPNAQTVSSQKAKNPKTSLLSLSSKSTSGRHSVSTVVSSYSRISQKEPQGQTSTEDSESSNSQEEMVIPDVESVVRHEFTETVTVTATLTSRGSTLRSRTQKGINQQWESGSQDSSSSSLIHDAIALQNINHATKYALEVSGSGETRSSSSGNSSSDSGHNRKLDLARKRPSEVQSSSRGKNIMSSNGGGYSGSRLRGHSVPSLSPSEPLISQERKTRNRPSYKDSTELVRKRQAPTPGIRPRMSERKDNRSRALVISDATSELPQVELTLSEAVPEYSTRFGRLGSSRCTAQSRHIDVEGIPEVLLALERFERNEELTYEQLLVLEANFPLSGLAFHDRHREMRLDIDNMSYEELLALEEEIGTVSTALTEEAMTRCLKRTVMSLIPGINDLGDDDTKCSICQEEYVIGDEVGELDCNHRYHVACIHQWLGQKNWCPICKASMCSS